MNKFLLLTTVLITLLGASCSARKSGPLQGSTHGKSTHQGASKSPHTGNSNKSNGRSTAGNDYIQRYQRVAIAEMNKYGIPASIKLAQALLESGAGNSYLAREANNHFGIKCGGIWKGRSVTRPDDAVNDCFRVYSNPEESFRDHSDFLLRKRYEGLFKLAKNDYKGWAKGLKAAGYATNPRYADLLIDMIERYELHRFDKGETFVEKEQREVIVLEEIKQHKITEPTRVAEQIKSPVAMRIHEVKVKETLYSLSRLYQVSVDQLKILNALPDDAISVGQLLVISK